jgi:hypothetical protein
MKIYKYDEFYLLEDWRLLNAKNKLNAERYVRDNFLRLVKLFDIDEDDYDIEQKSKILIDYFTKYPEQIKTISVMTVGNPNQLVVPKLNNIGGVIKYR